MQEMNLLDVILIGSLAGLVIAYLIVSHISRVHKRKLEGLRRFFEMMEDKDGK